MLGGVGKMQAFTAKAVGREDIPPKVTISHMGQTLTDGGEYYSGFTDPFYAASGDRSPAVFLMEPKQS